MVSDWSALRLTIISIEFLCLPTPPLCSGYAGHPQTLTLSLPAKPSIRPRLSFVSPLPCSERSQAWWSSIRDTGVNKEIIFPTCLHPSCVVYVCLLRLFCTHKLWVRFNILSSVRSSDCTSHTNLMKYNLRVSKPYFCKLVTSTFCHI